ncbi:hypothetical protein ABN072_08095 [Providencia rettgeri]|uniref:hypothetical protein n=1 Tax=Providencia rettgeri TaxID=587 RepID=UPI0032DB5122
MKEEAKEIVQAVSETIKERASNPIIVTFIISWCVYNWNALLLLAFSKEAIAKRIDIASLQFIETKSWLFPIIFTVGYCLLSKPLNAGLRKLMEKIDHFVISLEYSREMTKEKHEEKLEILKAKKEMAFDSTKTDEKNKIQKMNEEITKSKDREGVLTQEVTVLKSENESLKEKITNFEITQKQLKNQVDNTTTENSTLSQSKTMLEENEERLKIEINSLKNVISDFEKQASELIKANDTLKSKNNDLAKTVETYKNQLNPLISPKLAQVPMFSASGFNELQQKNDALKRSYLNELQLASDAWKNTAFGHAQAMADTWKKTALGNTQAIADAWKNTSLGNTISMVDAWKKAPLNNGQAHTDALKLTTASSSSEDSSNKLPLDSDNNDTKDIVDESKTKESD